VAKHSGGVLGTVAVGKTRAGHALTFVARRGGELSFQIRPAHGRAHKRQRETVSACEHVTIRLPAGAGVIALTASAGHARQSETRSY
jgi:hypothetical protein